MTEGESDRRPSILAHGHFWVTAIAALLTAVVGAMVMMKRTGDRVSRPEQASVTDPPSPAEKRLDPPTTDAGDVLLERLYRGRSLLQEGGCMSFSTGRHHGECHRDDVIRWAPGTERLVAEAGTLMASLGTMSQAAYEALDGDAVRRMRIRDARIAVPATIRAAIAIRTGRDVFVVLRRTDTGYRPGTPKAVYFDYVLFGPGPRAR